MYVPEHFSQDELPKLHEAMQKAGLCTLVTSNSSGLIASHIPILLTPHAGPYGTLYGHIAKANNQWQSINQEIEALVIFSGSDAYISPGWYATKKTTGKVVPTWNYVAIHAYGKIQFFDDADRLLKLVTRLTSLHESDRATPWAVTDAPEDFIQGMLKGIVGFELPISKLQGKWTLSQNQPAENRLGVINGLDDARKTEAAAAMRAANADLENGK
jgi:transcriptional regulator